MLETCYHIDLAASLGVLLNAFPVFNNSYGFTSSVAISTGILQDPSGYAILVTIVEPGAMSSIAELRSHVTLLLTEMFWSSIKIISGCSS